MSTRADEVSRQSPVPTSGPEGSDLRSVANRIEGLLDDDGHFNPNPEQISRGHPDYDESTDARAHPDRDERGRFKAAEATEQDDDISDAIEDIEAAGDESDEDTSDREAAASDTDEAQTESAVEEAETGEAETGDIQTLNELAQALEVPLDELKAAITHTFNAADEEVTVTLAELEAGYQKDADYRRQTGKLAEDRRQAEQIYQANMQQFETAHHQAAQLFNFVESLFGNELNDPRLAQLRESDPAEWTARREEIGQRVGALRNARQQAAQQYATFQHNQRAQLKAREQQMLLEKIPDFGSGHVQVARGAMESLGMAPAEIADIFDHRLVLGALELAVLRNEVATLKGEKTKAQDTVKRIKKEVPKLQKPGKQKMQSKRGIKRDNVQRLKDRARKSGTVDDAAKVIESMMG